MLEALTIVMTTLGGLGIFLLGMKHLSEGLQATAGDGLRKFMANATRHRIIGVASGIVSTAIMTLPQAFAVLIGANIGTTATVWIIAYAPNPQMLGLVGLAIGGAMYFFLRGERVHHLGLTVIGLGLVFMGLAFMSQGVVPIRENPGIARLFRLMTADSYAGILEVALLAALLTAVIQSSAATIAIAMALMAQNLISYEVAIAVLFGANVGTTATGWLAAIGGTADARRTALLHTLSNLLGSLVFVWFFPLFLRIRAIIPSDTGAIAITDTAFALCRGALFLPLVKPFVRFVEWLVAQPEDEKPHLSALTTGVKLSPVIACDQALREVDFMKESNLDLIACIRQIIAGEADEDVEKHVVHRESILDNVQKEVTEFLGAIMSKRLSISVAERARRLLRVTDELESVSDECTAILRVVKRLRRQKQRMSDTSIALILGVHDRIAVFAGEITRLICSPRVDFDLKRLQDESHDIHEHIRDCRRAQIGRVGPEDPGSSIRVLGELDIINAYARIGAYYLNCAETVTRGHRGR